MAQKKSEDTINQTTTKTATKTAAKTATKSTKSTTATAAKARKKQFKNDTPILCRSVTHGGLTYIGIGGVRYDWGGYGDIREIPYQDIISLKSRKSDFLYEPWLIIEDKDLMEKPDFEKAFGDMYKLYEAFETAEDFFDCTIAEMREKLQNAPNGFKQLILGSATELIRDGVLDSIGMINAIDDVMGTDLKMLIS